MLKPILALSLILLPSYVFASGGHGEAEAIGAIYLVAIVLLLTIVSVTSIFFVSTPASSGYGNFTLLVNIFLRLIFSVNVILLSIGGAFLLLWLISTIFNLSGGGNILTSLIIGISVFIFISIKVFWHLSRMTRSLAYPIGLNMAIFLPMTLLCLFYFRLL